VEIIIVFSYKILIDNYDLVRLKVISTEFDFVEPDKKRYRKEKIVITPEDTNLVREQIADTWDKYRTKILHRLVAKRIAIGAILKKQMSLQLSRFMIDESL
jgi:DNA helicase-2/ATP-dependent DNA helicase PcrA